MPRHARYLPHGVIPAVLLFGIPEHKDEVGSQAYAEDGIVQQALRTARKEFPELYYIGDVCMCEYTSHGHCGLLHDTSAPESAAGRDDPDPGRHSPSDRLPPDAGRAQWVGPILFYVSRKADFFDPSKVVCRKPPGWWVVSIYL